MSYANKIKTGLKKLEIQLINISSFNFLNYDVASNFDFAYSLVVHQDEKSSSSNLMMKNTFVQRMKSF